MDKSAAEQLFNGISLPSVDDAVFSNIVKIGEGFYARVIEGVQETDYIEYLKRLQSEGLKIISQTPSDIRHRVPNATLKKQQQIVTVTFNGYWNRIIITTYIDECTTPKNTGALICMIEAKKIFKEEVEDFGAGNYVMGVDNVTKVDYLSYLIKLDTLGFVKCADNEEGLNGSVFSATYIKGKNVVTVTYIQKLNKIYISTCYDLPVSEHLLCEDKNGKNNKKDAKTKLHMLEMRLSGNSFVFQLKNGRFIVSDGGTEEEIDYLMDYLRSLTPDNQKPIIEAWFISHAHRDHCGVLRAISEKPNYAKHVLVEGIYYNEPNNNVINLEPNTREEIHLIKEAAKVLRTTRGEAPRIYRPQTGQRYYFSDITVDILCGQEQLSIRDYTGDFNDSSTWCLFNIEGQKCLLGGDGDRAGIEFIMDAYEKEDMKFDVFTLLHHGHNTRDRFTDFCDVKTVLDTSNGKLPGYRTDQNNHLKEVTKEWISWADGTKILTFPYEVGKSEKLKKGE